MRPDPAAVDASGPAPRGRAVGRTTSSDAGSASTDGKECVGGDEASEAAETAMPRSLRQVASRHASKVRAARPAVRTYYYYYYYHHHHHHHHHHHYYYY